MTIGRFDVTGVTEVRKDPGGHEHHFTILIGVLREGTLRIADPLAVPRAGGGFWLGQIVGFERFRERLESPVTAESEAGRTLGVAIWGVAPPEDRVALGEARVLTLDEARSIATELSTLEPDVFRHCRDCRRLSRYIDKPC
jgi:hypothetical protein